MLSRSRTDRMASTLCFTRQRTSAIPLCGPVSASTPKVIDQIERYRSTLTHQASALLQRYVEVCRVLVRLEKMRFAVTPKEPPRPPGLISSENCKRSVGAKHRYGAAPHRIRL